MAIEVRSDQWTGEAADDLSASPRVYAEFPDRAALERAVAQLESSGGFRQGDMTQGRKSAGASADNADRVPPPDEHPLQADARNLRQLGVGIGGFVAGAAAAGAVVATGGAALPAVGAAAAASLGTAAAGEAIGKSAEPQTDADATKAGGQHPEGVDDRLALGVRAETEDKQAKAEEILRSCGASRVWRVAPAVG
jgi:hypothetical protein